MELEGRPHAAGRRTAWAYPQMANWLRNHQAAQPRFDIAAAIERLTLAA